MSKTRLTDRRRFLALAAVLSAVVVVAAVALTKVASADEFVSGILSGDVYPVEAACDVYGANEVAKADLLTGTYDGGNRMFMRLAAADPPRCFAWNIPLYLKVQKVLYMGSNGQLHVFVIKFADDLLVIITGSHTAEDPDPGPGLAGFQV